MKHFMLKVGLAVACLLLGFATFLKAQGEAKKETPPPESPAAKPAPDTKSVLMGESRASTAKAAEGAAKDKTKAPEKEESPKAEDNSAVTELHPLPPDKKEEKSSPKAEKEKKKSKSGPLKDVHGSVYGGSGSAAQATGGSAGASTRSGKTNIYIEGQTGQQNVPRR